MIFSHLLMCWIPSFVNNFVFKVTLQLVAFCSIQSDQPFAENIKKNLEIFNPFHLKIATGLWRHIFLMGIWIALFDILGSNTHNKIGIILEWNGLIFFNTGKIFWDIDLYLMRWRAEKNSWGTDLTVWASWANLQYVTNWSIMWNF